MTKNPTIPTATTICAVRQAEVPWWTELREGYRIAGGSQ
jgi:hypothetical protein